MALTCAAVDDVTAWCLLAVPPSVNGRLCLTLAENLPNCEKSDTLTLSIQQLSIYLNASVLSATYNADTNEKHSLAGIFRNQQLNLSGKVGKSILCSIPRPQNDPLNSVTIQMQLVVEEEFRSQNGLNAPLPLTGVRINQWGIQTHH
ncbi:hypothetical protein ANSO36C_59070 [Nostoc cf. commune SO-36]|uniref:Uncharacterized protein n=1 Tax=Nostoc cf. commune SO-36 TaxID=449208 RepID=A0ABN6QBW5_NOSCO|nr:hypothetical protein [Nostoc commune]BDI20105.1 hypothetical protein ANSO36C_59070 [Nostoc cf. commune SO-36]